MPQLFPPVANTLAKVSLALVIIVPAVGLITASAISRSPYNTGASVPIDQPVPFSHEHHVNELGLDCRFCHTGVETSPTAGLPPTHTCMSCHSQIWTNSPLLEPVRKSFETGEPIRWNLVNSVPDFVYFDHSVHVAKGVGCSECHGPVHKMQITYKEQPFHMAWCLDCHRNPAKNMRPAAKVFDPKYEKPADQTEVGRKLMEQCNVNTKQIMDCSACHR